MKSPLKVLDGLTVILLLVAVTSIAFAVLRPERQSVTGYLPVVYTADEAAGGDRLASDALARIESSELGRIGVEDAPVTLVVYSDYSCGACAMYDSILTEFRRRLPQHVRVIVKNFLPVVTRVNIVPHLAAFCADEQGMFESFHHEVFRSAKVLSTRDGWQDAGRRSGVPDMPRFEACVRSKAGATQVRRDSDEGQALGVTATPTSFLNGIIIVGAAPLERLLELAGRELDRAGS